jgi:hypothetical protein
VSASAHRIPRKQRNARVPDSPLRILSEHAIPSAAERLLDQAIEFTFPASDPISVEYAFRSARRRDRALAEADDAPRSQTRRTKPKRWRTSSAPR